ncbi:GlcNac transferase [Thraustotheca clavata]|uniref:GlcNac transferase n=1 Tax=Thraustotheca clavata TaxID=74557 RepID=A0A1W0A421_9STRA|nr:GlcNac transferase [Thraustotheca clavata]
MTLGQALTIAAMTWLTSGTYIYYDYPQGNQNQFFYEPTHQNTPLDANLAHLRPPPPRIPEIHDIFIGIAAYRDGIKCGFSIWTAFYRAAHPEHVFVGVVDQTLPGDHICIEEYCKLAQASWPGPLCRFKNQIRIDARNAAESKGPTLARYQQQQLIRDEEFCMEIDAHSQFLPNWDVEIVQEWARTNNEMGVLSSYPLDFSFIEKDLSKPSTYSSHLCGYLDRGRVEDIPIIYGMHLIHDAVVPQMSALWGACLSFSKCHAEKRVPIDKHMNWVFWGEEYLRTFQLWTHGYDIYSPSRLGSVVFHNWTHEPNKKKFTDNVTRSGDQATHDQEETLAYNRLRLLLNLPFQGDTDAKEMHIFNPPPVRTVDQFLAFTGISNVDPKQDTWTCGKQLHWVPYAVPSIVEELLPGWSMYHQDNRQQEEFAMELDMAQQGTTRLLWFLWLAPLALVLSAFGIVYFRRSKKATKYTPVATR